MPDLPERYAAAAAAIIAAMDRLTLFRMLEGTRAALVVADWMIGRYEQLKSARGLLDFDDLVTRTVRLLARQDAGAWVHYKLDQGLDHILVDEAQDTSPASGRSSGALAEEFFAGEGSRDDVLRTLFAVGDEKQSIYSFQGAVAGIVCRDAARIPAPHPRRRGRLRARAADALLPLDQRRARRRRRGLRQRGGAGAASRTTRTAVQHGAIRGQEPGYVELWPMLGAEAVPEAGRLDAARSIIARAARGAASPRPSR